MTSALVSREAVDTAIKSGPFAAFLARGPALAWIDGKRVAARSGETLASENPATGETVCHVAACDTADVDAAVVAARAAFPAWSATAPADRKRILLRFADLIDAHTDTLALMDCLEGGKPVGVTAAMDIPDTSACIRFHAESIDKLFDAVAPTPANVLATVVRVPVGVVGAVVPWNFPAQMAAWKLGPALATGNCVVLKPSELTSLSALFMAELAHEAGLPSGVLNVVPGLGPTAGAAIGRHMDIDCVAFTGSTEVGRYFLQYSATSNLKRISLELGGKSPQLVFADADLDLVAENAMNAAFWNQSENCSCGSRLIVQRSVKDALLAKMIAKAQTEWPLGDPRDPTVKVGPMIEKAHLEKVLSYIAVGKAEGARIVLGGNQVRRESGGYFVELTIFDDVTNAMRVAREEIFGPVLSVISFDEEEEGIAIANDTPYGLAASVYSRDFSRAHRAARALRAGTVSVNCFSEGDMTTPFGGFKQSGFGGRDKSVYAHNSYTELKTTWMHLG